MHKTKARQDLDAVINTLFSANNPDAIRTLAFVQRLLCQYGLSRTYEAKDILIEVYARAAKLTNAGTTIYNPLPWIRRTSLNVVREFKREAVKVEYYNLNNEPAWSEGDFLSLIVFKYDLKAMRIAFERLEAADRDLLGLRVIQKLSWHDVNKHLVERGGDDQHESALRQQGFRALKKLKKIYMEEREQIQFDLNEVELPSK
jgi:DNA-directed RNA polymerase specialized sigma24 family protein